MSREREEHGLSTADLAAAADTQQRQEPRDVSQSPRDVPEMPRNEMDGGGAPMRDGRDANEQLAPLFERERAEDMRMHWGNIQAGFVDDPRRAVRQADELVAQVMKDLAESFARQREQIEAEATAGGDAPASTENLRIALRRYRSFFERLLTL
jgi:hypothetical protein